MMHSDSLRQMAWKRSKGIWDSEIMSLIYWNLWVRVKRFRGENHITSVTAKPL